MLTTVEEAPPKVKARRFSRSEYYGMAEMGFFIGENVERIEGEIVVMSPQKPKHRWSAKSAFDALTRAFGKGFQIFRHEPLSLGDSDPEPDVSVVRGDDNDFASDHPSTAELVVEVSLTTYAYDSGKKASIYARAGIPEYWIVNLLKNQLEVFRDPQKVSAKSCMYSSIRILRPGSFVSPLALPKAKIPVADLFPPVSK